MTSYSFNIISDVHHAIGFIYSVEIVILLVAINSVGSDLQLYKRNRKGLFAEKENPDLTGLFRAKPTDLVLFVDS